MIGDSIRAVIDLLKLRKDEKKLDLEIDKLQREKAAAARASSEPTIMIASLDDI